MEQQVYTIAEFCAANRISRTRLYLEFKAGTGPKHYFVGTRILIRAEAAAAWRAEREAATAQHEVAA